MIYITDNGERVEAPTPLDLIRYLRDTSFFLSDQTELDFMLGFARRHQEFFEGSIRTFSHEAFVEDLIKYKYVEKI